MTEQAVALTEGPAAARGVDPHFYTSVHQWKPVTPERFIALLHDYQSEHRNMDPSGNGQMNTKWMRLDRFTSAVIHYTRKSEGSPVLSPVLMTMEYGGAKPKVVCFVSLIYGKEADPDLAGR